MRGQYLFGTLGGIGITAVAQVGETRRGRLAVVKIKRFGQCFAHDFRHRDAILMSFSFYRGCYLVGQGYSGAFHTYILS